MRIVHAALAATLAATAPLRAQEVGAFSTVTLPGRSYWPATYGVGVAFAGYFRFGAIVGPDLGFLKESPLRLGVRVGASEHTGTLKDGSALRMGAYHASVMVRPSHNALSRFEVGGGVAGYSVRSSFRDSGWSFTGTLGLSRRTHERSALWATVGYDIHSELDTPDLAGTTSADGIIAHTVRLGVTYKFGATN